MSRKSIVVGRGGFAAALAAVTGTALIEKTPAPAITRNGAPLETDVSEETLRQRISQTESLGVFREQVRMALAQTPEIRHSMLTLAARFNAHEGYPKLVAILSAIKEEMNKAEFDFGDPLRLQRWINHMFNRKAGATS